MLGNTLKTITLLLILSFICIGIGGLFGPQGMQIAFFLALCMNGIIYFFSDKIVLTLYGAKPLDLQWYKNIHEDVAHLAHLMHMPKPRLWIIDSAQANAFATGRSPKHASIALTTGIIEILDRDELHGVLAHELSHIKNRDIFISTIAATIAGVICHLSYMLRHKAFWGSYDNNRKSSTNPLLLFIAGLVLPFIATLIQLAISRSREYQADETGARATQDPLALASALQKLHTHTQQIKHEYRYRPAIALGIVHPLSGKKFLELFSTHPPMENRIKRLENLHRNCFK